jgi:hypothetical protein
MNSASSNAELTCTLVTLVGRLSRRPFAADGGENAGYVFGRMCVCETA